MMNAQSRNLEDNQEAKKTNDSDDETGKALNLSRTVQTTGTKSQSKGEGTKLDVHSRTNEIRTTSSQSTMAGTQKNTSSTEKSGKEEQGIRGRSKVIFNIPSSTDSDQQEPSPVLDEGTEKIASEISHVGRVFEASVASDMSGLTDGEFFKMDDLSVSSLTASNTASNKIVGTATRAPEPPMVSSGTSKLNDILSETTDTTVSSSRDEKLSKTKKKRSVVFGGVQVRNYERVLEINPSVTSGPAVGIGWNYSPDEDVIIPIDNFEQSRKYLRRQNPLELAISRDRREDMLRRLGYSQKDIAWSIRSILRSKNQRKQTIQNLHAAQMEEFVEKATRKMKHVFKFPLSNLKKAKQIPAYQLQSPAIIRKASILQPSAA